MGRSGPLCRNRAPTENNSHWVERLGNAANQPCKIGKRQECWKFGEKSREADGASLCGTLDWLVSTGRQAETYRSIADQPRARILRHGS